MRQSRTSGSVGTLGEQSPRVTRPGNVSGRCPECGAFFDRRSLIAAQQANRGEASGRVQSPDRLLREGR